MDDPVEGEELRREPPVMGFTVERLNALSDGVFAVAITLLAVGIALPTIHGTATNSKVAHGLAELWPHFFSYLLSFIIVAMFWISHHSLFTVIRRVDRVLIWMNVFYLLLIVFMPYPTQLLSLYGKTGVAVALYAAVLALAALVQGFMALYATRGHRLVDDDFDTLQAGQFLRNSFVKSGILAVSIGIAFLSPTIAQLSWLLLFLIPLFEWLFFRKRYTRAGVGEGQAA